MDTINFISVLDEMDECIESMRKLRRELEILHEKIEDERLEATDE